MEKICEKCQNKCHPRLKVCKNCGNKFIFKIKCKNKEKYKSTNWLELVKGDKIKVMGGPYWVNSKGVKIKIGYKGKYSVDSLDKNGIIAYGIGKSSGYCHIWMGKKYKNGEGIVKIAHKIKKIN